MNEHEGDTCFSCYYHGFLCMVPCLFATGPQRNGRARMCQWPEQACRGWFCFTTHKDDRNQIKFSPCLVALLTHHDIYVYVHMHYIQIIHGLFNKSKSNYLQLISRTLTGLKEWGGYSLNWRSRKWFKHWNGRCCNQHLQSTSRWPYVFSSTDKSKVWSFNTSQGFASKFGGGTV